MLPFQILNYKYGFAALMLLNGVATRNASKFGCRVTPVNWYRLSVATTNKLQAFIQLLRKELLTAKINGVPLAFTYCTLNKAVHSML